MITWKALGQTRPAGTASAFLYLPPASTVQSVVKRIHCYNDTVNSVKVNIFADVDGFVADKNSALYYEVLLGSDSELVIENLCIPLDQNGALMVQTDIGDTVNFTAYGVEYYPDDLLNGEEFFVFDQVRPAGAGTPYDITGSGGSNPLSADYDYTLENLIICNTDTNHSEVKIYNDVNGNVFDKNSGIYNIVPVFKQTTVNLTNLGLPLNSDGALAVESGVSTAICYSLFGRRTPKRRI